MEDASWRKVLDVNLTGPYLMSKRFARRVIDAGSRGKIVNISSKSGFQVTTGGHGHYATAKAGVNMLTRVLARELSGKGIVVSGVAPGMVRTPLNEEKWAQPGMTEYYLKRLPLGRFAEPAEIGFLVAFLLSDKSDNINGAVVDCTGGMLI
jgi:NAD(P)-dependent dehydrogenase (short-subunit alcohol dehydrogenase family)